MSNGRNVSQCCEAPWYAILDFSGLGRCGKCGGTGPSNKLPHERPYARSPKKSYPQPDSLWRHYKGGLYQYLFTAFSEAEMAPMAVYKPVDEPKMESVTKWVRPLEEFMQKFKRERR